MVHLGDNDHDIKDENFPERSVKDAENYCRSPGFTHSGDTPWCFIINNFEGVIERLKKGEKVEEKDILDHCDVQFCKGKHSISSKSHKTSKNKIDDRDILTEVPPSGHLLSATNSCRGGPPRNPDPGVHLVAF